MWPAGLRQATGRPPGAGVPPTTGRPGAWPGTWPPSPGGEVPLLPARDFLFHPGAASRQWEHQRLEILARLTRGDCPVLVATVEGLLQRTLPPAVFAGHCRQLSVGQVCQLEEVADFLVQAGYTRCDQVEGTGQFALRGGILDVFSPGLDLPVRMEFWGDEIDSLGLFDPVTQRRTAQREAVTLLPAGEVLAPAGQALPDPPDLALATVYDTLTTPADYLPPRPWSASATPPGWPSRPSTISGSWGRTSPPCWSRGSSPPSTRCSPRPLRGCATAWPRGPCCTWTPS